MSRKKRKFLKTTEQKSEKAEAKSSAPNPFELRVNRKKHDVIGQKVRGERGHVVKSRTIATERRRRTLLPQLQQKDKVNMFVDRRFGENDATMTLEEKMLLRFAVERKKRHEKAGLYNLNDGDDEELTHLGRSLAEIDEFTERDLRLTDDEDEAGGGFDAQTTEALHFGGFERPDGASRPKSRKEIMHEIIAKSKLHKLERQKEREEQEDATEALDKELQTLMRAGLLTQRNRHDEKAAELAIKPDDYDKAVRALGFEARAQATDRMKTDEEKAKEQFAKLQQLEAVRRARMRGEDPADQGVGAVDPSVEELGGNVALEEDTEVYYEDGVLMKDGERLDLRLKAVNKRALDDDKEEEEEEEEGSEDETHVDEDDDEDDDDEGSEYEDEDVSTDDEAASDLELDDGDGEGEDDEEASGNEGEDGSADDAKGGWQAIAARMAARTQAGSAPQPKSNVRVLNIGSGRDTKPKADANDLPYTFTAPADLGDWLELVEERTAKEVLTIMVRMRACHHVKLHPDNRAKMELFLRIVVEYAVYLCEAPAVKPEFRRTVLDKLPIILFAMATDMPQCAADVFREELQVAADALTKSLRNPTGARLVPARTLLILQYIVLLYPTSDLRHAVTTPAMYLMAQILSHMPVRSHADVGVMLFVASLTMAFVRDSKRFVPEAVNVVAGLLDRFASANGVAASASLCAQSIPTLAHMPDHVLLLNRAAAAKKRGARDDAKVSLWAAWGLEAGGLEGDALVAALMNATLRLAERSVELWGAVKCFNDIAAPLHAHVDRVAEVGASATLQARAAEVSGSLALAREKCVNGRTHMMAQRRKPIALRQFNPKFEDKYVAGQSYDPDKDRREARKLKHLYKRELKGAKREIQKDSAFIARERHRETKAMDADRTAKTKRLFSLLQDTQAEANEQKRMKKKLKAKKT